MLVIAHYELRASKKTRRVRNVFTVISSSVEEGETGEPGITSNKSPLSNNDLPAPNSQHTRRTELNRKKLATRAAQYTLPSLACD